MTRAPVRRGGRHSILLAVSAVVLLLGAAACTWPPRRSGGRAGAGEDPEARAARAARVAEGLAPFRRFLGDWEGTDQSLRGNFQVARRLSWLVPNSFLLEQWRFLDGDGKEVARSANLYSFDPGVGLVRVEMLGEAGEARILWLRFTPDGLSWTLHEAQAGPAASRFRTLRFQGDTWDAALEVAAPGPGEGGETAWRVVEQVSLTRRH